MSVPPVLANRGDAQQRLGERVRVTGTVQREKPGDAVIAGDLDVLCPDHRFDEVLLGRVITVEGTLRRIQLPEATVNERGEISQGVMPGSEARYALGTPVIIQDADRAT